MLGRCKCILIKFCLYPITWTPLHPHSRTSYVCKKKNFISILQITAFTLKNFLCEKTIHLLVRMKITYVKPGPAKFFSNNCRYIMNSSWYL